MVQNKAVIFKKVPVAAPVAGETLVVESSEFDLDTSPPTDGITSKTLFSSLDPYMRGRMREPSAKSYSPPFALGEPLTGGAVFQVLKSANAKFKSGDVLVGFSPMAEYAVIPAEVLALARVIDNPKHLPLSTFLGALGMTGLTAYASLQEIGKPKKGETIFISAASGAVGQVVGQIAKNEGLKVIGSVGSDDKLKLITETLGFDAGFNYKKESVKDALPRLAPEGIDIYYENVGGEHLEAALGNMNTHGRIVTCGMISQYNLPRDQMYGVKNLVEIVSRRLLMRGFIVGDPDMGPRHSAGLAKDVGAWIADGSFKPLEHVVPGIDQGPAAFVGMLNGENVGKTILKVADP